MRSSSIQARSRRISKTSKAQYATSKQNPQILPPSNTVHTNKMSLENYSNQGYTQEPFRKSGNWPSKSMQGKFYDVIVNQNKDYFRELGKTYCSKRPLRNKLKLGRVNGHSLYAYDFQDKQFIPNDKIQLPIKKQIPRKTFSDSLYRTQFSFNKAKPACLLKPNDQKIRNYPTQQHSTYRHDFPGALNAPANKVNQQQNFEYAGYLPFQGKSIYEQDFKLANKKKSDICQPGSKMKTMNAGFYPFCSTYNSFFKGQQSDIPSSFKPLDPARTARGFFSSQYKSQLKDKLNSSLIKSKPGQIPELDKLISV